MIALGAFSVLLDLAEFISYPLTKNRIGAIIYALDDDFAGEDAKAKAT